MSDQHQRRGKRKASGLPPSSVPEGQAAWVQSWISELAVAQQALQSQDEEPQTSQDAIGQTQRPAEQRQPAAAQDVAADVGRTNAASSADNRDTGRRASRPEDTATALDEGPLIFAACGGVVGVRSDAATGGFSASFVALRRSTDNQYSFAQQVCSIAIPGDGSLISSSTPLVGAAVFDAASGFMRPYILCRVGRDRLQVVQLDLALSQSRILAAVDHAEVRHVRRSHCQVANGPSFTMQLPSQQLLVFACNHAIEAQHGTAQQPANMRLKELADTAWHAEVLDLDSMGCTGALHPLLSYGGTCGPTDPVRWPSILLAKQPSSPAAGRHVASHGAEAMDVEASQHAQLSKHARLVKLSSSSGKVDASHSHWQAHFAEVDPSLAEAAITAACLVPAGRQLAAASLMNGTPQPDPQVAVTTDTGQLAVWRPCWWRSVQSKSSRSSSPHAASHHDQDNQPAGWPVKAAATCGQQLDRVAAQDRLGFAAGQLGPISQREEPEHDPHAASLPHAVQSLAYMPSGQGLLIAHCDNLQRTALVLDAHSLQQQSAVPAIRAMTVDNMTELVAASELGGATGRSTAGTAQAGNTIADELLPALLVMEGTAAGEGDGQQLEDGVLVADAFGRRIAMLTYAACMPAGEQQRASQASAGSLHTVVRGLRHRLDTGCQQLEHAQRTHQQKQRLVTSSNHLLRQLCQSTWRPCQHAPPTADPRVVRNQQTQAMVVVTSVEHQYSAGQVVVTVKVALDAAWRASPRRAGQLLLSSPSLALSAETQVTLDSATGTALFAATADVQFLPSQGDRRAETAVYVSVAIPDQCSDTSTAQLAPQAVDGLHIQHVGSFVVQRGLLLRSQGMAPGALPAMPAGQPHSVPSRPPELQPGSRLHSGDTAVTAEVEAGAVKSEPSGKAWCSQQQAAQLEPAQQQQQEHEQQGEQQAKQQQHDHGPAQVPSQEGQCVRHMLLTAEQQSLTDMVHALCGELGMAVGSHAGSTLQLRGASSAISIQQYGDQHAEATFRARSDARLDLLVECAQQVVGGGLSPSPVSEDAITGMGCATSALSLELEDSISWIEQELSRLPVLGPHAADMDVLPAVETQAPAAAQLQSSYRHVLALQQTTDHAVQACMI